MSSVVIWSDEATGVTASWNKEGPYTVFVPVSIDEDGICDGITTQWSAEKAAIGAAEATALEQLEKMRSEDPSGRRYRVLSETHSVDDRGSELRDLAWLGNHQRFGAAALSAIGTLPVGGTFKGISEGRDVTIQRVR